MQEEGYVAKLLYEAGSKDIPLGKVLAILVEDKEDIAAFADYKADDAGAAPAAPKAAEAPAAAAPTPSAAPTPTPSAAAPARPSGERVFVSPLAQNMANAHGVDLSTLQGTGPKGRIIKADIEDALAAGPATTAPVLDTPA